MTSSRGMRDGGEKVAFAAARARIELPDRIHRIDRMRRRKGLKLRDRPAPQAVGFSRSRQEGEEEKKPE